MRIKVVYILFFLLTQTSLGLYAQENEVKGYRIEGDEIVFTFDKRDYDKVTDEKNQERMDFDDFDIKNVVVSGQFNLWSRDAWKMKKVNENIYELRKKIIDFKDNFEWEFKFVINNNYWAEPSKDIANITPATEKNGKALYVYNLTLVSAYPSKDGNAIFQLKGYEDAKEVIVTGSFNKWDRKLFKMNKTDDGWELKLELRPGIHQYKFIVDEQWMHDPNNKMKVKNEYHEYNSLIEIKTDAIFTLFNYHDAKKVMLAGDFNGWSESNCEMIKSDKGWTQTIQLTGGKYHYKFIVDGQWILDPNNTVKEYDGKGHINSVKMVR